MIRVLVCLAVGVRLLLVADAQNVTENEIRPYEFTFNIVDFQHRAERKDDDGLITGEYGFITADGIYHETEYATDKTGDFIITKMRHRRIASLKDAEEIFKDKPEQAKMLAEALAESMPTDPPKKMDLAVMEMMKVLNKKENSSDDAVIRDMIDAARKVTESDANEIERMANELFYHFNFTAASHAHREVGFRDGTKDGEYDAADARVRYVSNEFGFQPNVTLVSLEEEAEEELNVTTTTEAPVHYFNWFK